MLKRLHQLLLLLLLAACAKPQAPGFYQYAIFDEFAAGQLGGTMPLSELKKHGDFGIGTFHGLDGEMVVLDGTIYQADHNLAISQPPLDTLSPFAHLVFFKPQGSAPVSFQGDAKGLGTWLDAKLPAGQFAAARVKATFKRLKIRSPAASMPPYPTLGDALKTQRVEELSDASGTLVCMRGPDQPTGAWVAGWHMHFVSADGKKGGHVLALEGVEGQAAWMASTHYTLELPPAR